MSAQSESSSRPADVGLVLLTLAVGLGLLTLSWGALHLPPFDRYQIIDTPVYQEYGEAMAAGQVPYRDFELEYPPGALPVFWLPTLGPAEHYRSIFEALMWICAAALLVIVVRSAAALDASPRRLLAIAVALGLFPLALGSVVLTRYDLWPAALAAAALAAVLLGRPRLGLAVLGTRRRGEDLPARPPAAAPDLPRPQARAAGGGDRTRRLRRGAGARGRSLRARRPGRPVGLGLAPARPAASDREPRRLRCFWPPTSSASTSPTVVSTHGSQNLSGSLPDALATLQTVLQAGALVAVWALFARGPATAERLVAACAGSVVVFVAFGKVLSPQFLIWLVPVVPLVMGRIGLAAGGFLGAALISTHLWFPTRYWDMVDLQPVGWVVLVRNVLLVALAVVLAVATARARAPARSP